MGQPPSSCKCTYEVCYANSPDVGSLKVEIPHEPDGVVDNLPEQATTRFQVAGLKSSDTQQNNDGFTEATAGTEAEKTDTVSLKSEPTSSDIVQSEDVRVEYVVVFQNSGNTKIGLNIDVDIDDQSGSGFSINSISGGLAAEWNGKAPAGERIVPGDEIIEVNGIQGDKRLMMKNLNDHTVRLVLLGCPAQRFRYEGQWQDNVWHGDGVVKRPDGSRYEGQFANGVAHGLGKFLKPNGNKYEGQWERNFVHGFGKYTYEDGSYYEGEWSQNQKSGKGKQNTADGCCYEGEFLNNVRHGVGIQWQDEMVVYEGQWRDDLMDGEGKIICADGRTLKGQLRDGEMNGHGTMTYPSGSVYEGGFLNHKKHGEGTFSWSDGRVYSGQWRNNKQDGTGTLTDAKGVCLGKSRWRDGRRIDAPA